MPSAADEHRVAPRRRAGRPLAGQAVTVLLAAAALAAGGAYAQSDDVPLAPRLDRAAEAARTTAPGRLPGNARGEARGEILFELRPQDVTETTPQAPPSALDTFVRPPNAARLAPLPEERSSQSGVEEIIVLGGNWRLPDLGSRWRARQEAAEDAGVAHVTLLPLYDPERPTRFNNTFLLNREVERIGYIDLFRLRFGKRTKSDDEQ